MNRRKFQLSLLPMFAGLAGCALFKPQPSVPGQPNPPSVGIQILQNIIAIAGTLLSMLGPALGIPAPLMTAITAWVQAIGTAVLDVIAALKSGTVLNRADAVIVALAKLAASAPLAGAIPVNVQNIIKSIAAAVDAFVQSAATGATFGARAKVVVPPADSAALVKLEADAKALAKKG